MSTCVSSWAGWSMRRIHHPGFALGAKVSVCLQLPSNVPTPATGASPASVTRVGGNGQRRSGASRISSIGSARKPS